MVLRAIVPQNSPQNERIVTTVVALQGEVDLSPRSGSGTNLTTERSEVKVAAISAVSANERMLVVFLSEAKAL